jgi:hypothetical protein
LEVFYTARHAQWALDTQQDPRSADATERLAARRLNHLDPAPRPATNALSQDMSSTSVDNWVTRP